MGGRRLDLRSRRHSFAISAIGDRGQSTPGRVLRFEVGRCANDERLKGLTKAAAWPDRSAIQRPSKYHRATVAMVGEPSREDSVGNCCSIAAFSMVSHQLLPGTTISVRIWLRS